jgi:hypothetical protein
MDTDDEWGRTEAITLRSLIDHVTDIWVNLYGTTPSSGGGIAGSNTEILKIVDTTNSRIVLPKGSGPASSNTTSQTILEDGSLTFNGVTNGVGIYACGAAFNHGFRIDASQVNLKQILFYDQSNFGILAQKAGTLNQFQIKVPTGVNDADTLIFTLGENGVNFSTSVPFSAGASTLTSLSTGTVSATKVAVGSYTELIDGSIYYCDGTSTSNWLLTQNRLVLGNNTSGSNRIDLNHTNGLQFYCGAGGSLSGVVNGSLVSLYGSTGVRSATIEGGNGVATFKLQGGAEMVMSGTTTQNINITSDNIYLYDKDTGTNRYLRFDKGKISFFNSEDHLSLTQDRIGMPFGATYGCSSLTFSLNTISANTHFFKVTDDSGLNVTTITFPDTPTREGGMSIYCGSNYGAEYYGSYMRFVTSGTQRMTLNSSRIGLHEGPQLRFSGTTPGTHTMQMDSDTVNFYCGSTSSSDRFTISANYWAFFGSSSGQTLTASKGSGSTAYLKHNNGPIISFNTNASDTDVLSFEAQPGRNLRFLLQDIPTSDPGIPGVVWNSSGTLMIST